jgi:CubicO group peptidase (beta-lactamase class C family)
LPFAIVGVADAQGVLRVDAFDAGADTRIDADAVCLLASITKPIAATAVLQLVDAGLVELTGSIGDVAPDLVNPAWAPITPWHVLTHTSGLDDVNLEAVILAGEGREDLLRRLREQPQATPPGSRYHYASEPFELLAEVAAARTGETLETAMRRTLLEPLGMSSTTFDPRGDAALAARVAPVVVAGPEGHPLPQSAALVAGYTRLHLLGGGLWSTAGDLLRFGRAMLRGGELDGVRVLSPAYLRLMLTEVTTPRDVHTPGGLGWHEDPLRSEHYALGWGRPGIASVASSASFGHGGASGTRLWIDPTLDLVFVYLTGSWSLPTAPIDAVQAAVYASLSESER